MRKYRNNCFLFGLILGLAVWMQAPVADESCLKGKCLPCSAQASVTDKNCPKGKCLVCKCLPCTTQGIKGTVGIGTFLKRICPTPPCPIETENNSGNPITIGPRALMIIVEWCEKNGMTPNDISHLERLLPNVWNDKNLFQKYLEEKGIKGNDLSKLKNLRNFLQNEQKFKDTGLAQLPISERFVIFRDSLAGFSKQPQFQPDLKLQEELKVPVLLQPPLHQPQILKPMTSSGQ